MIVAGPKDVRIVLTYFDEAEYRFVRVRCDGYGCTLDESSVCYHLPTPWAVNRTYLDQIGDRFRKELTEAMGIDLCPA